MLSWPDTLCPVGGGFAPFALSLSGGRSLSGIEQIQSQLQDRWGASFTFHLNSKTRIFALRSMLTQLRGRSGTILVPTFENGRAPLSAATPGSPIGAVIVNPPFTRPSTTSGSPVGDVAVNPAFWRRWPEVEGTSYEYTALAAVTGTAVIASPHRAVFVATGDAPEADTYITLDGERRRILSAEFISGSWHIVFTPQLPVLPDTVSYNAVGVTGSATVLSATRVSFAATAGVPAVGDRITLSAVAREVLAVIGSGPYQIVFSPPLTVAASTPGTVAAVADADAAINATTLDVHVTTGSAPLPGNFFSLGNYLHSINTVTDLGGAVYRLDIWPWLRAAVTDGDTVNFTSPACEMRLASDSEGADALRSLAGRRFGDVTLSFDEVATA